MGVAELTQTEVITLPVGAHTIEVEVAADLDALMQSGLRNDDLPCWAYVWPSGRALVGLLADLEDLSGRRVLDLGCGPGAVGLAAGRLGADVVFADLSPGAVALATRNAERNGLDTAQVLELDWNAPPADLGTFDMVVGADLFYADGLLRGVLRFLKGHLRADGIAYLADPGRVMPGGVAGAARLSGLEVREHALAEGRALGNVTVYAVQRRPRRL